MESKVLLRDFFEIISSIQDDKINFELSDKSDPNAIPFLGRSRTNNGIVDYVTPKKSKLNKGGIITIALDGSTGATFFQHSNFASGQNIWLLKPIDNKFENFNVYVALYCITSIRKAVSDYSFNLGLTKTRLSEISILLDVEGNNVDVSSIEYRMRSLRNADLLNRINTKRIDVSQ